MKNSSNFSKNVPKVATAFFLYFDVLQSTPKVFGRKCHPSLSIIAKYGGTEFATKVQLTV